MNFINKNGISTSYIDDASRVTVIPIIIFLIMSLLFHNANEVPHTCFQCPRVLTDDLPVQTCHRILQFPPLRVFLAIPHSYAPPWSCVFCSLLRQSSAQKFLKEVCVSHWVGDLESCFLGII
jgi:hypothetical protein